MNIAPFPAPPVKVFANQLTPVCNKVPPPRNTLAPSNIFNIPPPGILVNLFTISNKAVNPSTASLITLLSARPIVNWSQAFESLFNLASNESKVFSNCLSLAPALILAASTSSNVLS